MRQPNRRATATSLGLLFFTVLGAAGCAGGSAPTDGGFICTPACPSGFTCSVGGCVDDGADLAVHLPDGAGDLGGCPAPCAAPTPLCDPATRTCVPCLVDGDCGPAQVCRSFGGQKACLPGCTDDSRCANASDGGAGARCCGGACSDTTADPSNCGACGTACAFANATSVCAGGSCALGACARGFGDCNALPADGCEVSLRVDPQNCGACGHACAFDNAVPACSDGCYLAACDYGFADCDGDPSTGCEVDWLTDPRNCGACGTACTGLYQGVVGCVLGQCGLVSCNPGYADCDRNPKNGCEVNTASDANNCGGCAVVCGPGLVCKAGGCTCANCLLPNARAACVSQMCVISSCNPGFADCDKVPGNGCEANLNADPNNCGACNFRCNNALPFCQGGVCSKTATSCKAILDGAPGAKSGVYTIDPDGMSAFQVWCEMTVDGGGWTLALRGQATNSTFRDFFNPLWTNTTTLNDLANIDDTFDGDAKYGSFARLAGKEIRGCLLDQNKGTFGCKFYTYAMAPQTLKDLFLTTPVGSDISGKALFFDEKDPESWLKMWGHSYADSSCNPPGYHRVGINIDDDQSCYRARVRFGLALNNEANINTLNDTAGFGASAYCDQNVCDNVTESCWRVGTGFQSANTTYGTTGTMWVR